MHIFALPPKAAYFGLVFRLGLFSTKTTILAGLTLSALVGVVAVIIICKKKEAGIS